jgi:hypothetical protein
MGKMNMNEEMSKETCGKMCEDNKECGNNRQLKKVDEFTQDFRAHGLGCGNKIADIAKEIHPDALAIVPLYRSCIVVEQSEEEKKEGVCTLHSYADPHWLGGEIDADTLKSDDFHFEFCVRGERQGPAIVNKNHNEEDGQEEDKVIIENDEN